MVARFQACGYRISTFPTAPKGIKTIFYYNNYKIITFLNNFEYVTFSNNALKVLVGWFRYNLWSAPFSQFSSIPLHSVDKTAVEKIYLRLVSIFCQGETDFNNKTTGLYRKLLLYTPATYNVNWFHTEWTYNKYTQVL